MSRVVFVHGLAYPVTSVDCFLFVLLCVFRVWQAMSFVTLVCIFVSRSFVCVSEGLIYPVTLRVCTLLDILRRVCIQMLSLAPLCLL